MRLLVKPTPGSPRSSAPLTLAEVMNHWRLNPPPFRFAERTAHHLRRYAAMETGELRSMLPELKRRADRLEFMTENPPDSWTAEKWLEAMQEAEDAAAAITAARRVLAGRK